LMVKKVVDFKENDMTIKFAILVVSS